MVKLIFADDANLYPTRPHSAPEADAHDAKYK
jgi:hypothetical protein